MRRIVCAIFVFGVLGCGGSADEPSNWKEACSEGELVDQGNCSSRQECYENVNQARASQGLDVPPKSFARCFEVGPFDGLCQYCPNF